MTILDIHIFFKGKLIICVFSKHTKRIFIQSYKSISSVLKLLNKLTLTDLINNFEKFKPSKYVFCTFYMQIIETVLRNEILCSKLVFHI